MGNSKRVAVVGAGIAGLAAAYEASRHPGWQVTLFEASGRLGGTVETVREGGFTIECGPDSWVSERSAVQDLAQELGLGDEIIHSNDAIRRNYLAVNCEPGRALTPMPDGMRMMVPTRWLPIMESPLFSWAARLAYLREPKRADELKREAAARSEDFDESVRSFVTRHFGAEATDTIAGPLLAGVFGGDIDTLSAGAVLAPFVRMEREHGSLIAPTMARALAERAAGAPQPIFTTLRSGLSVLVERIASILPAGALRLHATVRSIRRITEGWAVESDTSGRNDYDALVLATPAHVTSSLLAEVDSEASALLEMPATSAVIVALCFPAEASRGLRIPRGFGFLVPPSRALSDAPELLAGTFMDQKFAHRAPPGCCFLRGFFGGHSAPHMLGWSDERIAAAARVQFSRFLGPLPEPRHTVVRRWPYSLPQYAVGHPARMRKLDALVRGLGRVALSGNAYRGVGLPALVEHARASVAALLDEQRSPWDA